MCNLSQSVEDKGIEKGIAMGIKEGREIGIAMGIEEGKEIGIAIGIEEGREIGILHSLQNLMKNLKMPVDEALSTLEIPETYWKKYRNLLAGQ